MFFLADAPQPLLLLKACLNDGLPEGWKEWTMEHLPAEQQEMIKKYRIDQDRQLRLLVRLLLAAGLQMVEGSSVSEALQNLDKEEKGRPFVKKSAWECSFSHSHGVALCLLGERQHCGKVGVDAEHIKPLELEEVAIAFCEEEQHDIRNAPDAQKRLFDVWACKEAVLKVFGTGFLHEPCKVNTLCPLPIPSIPSLAVQNIILAGQPEYAAAVAIEKGPLLPVIQVSPFHEWAVTLE